MEASHIHLCQVKPLLHFLSVSLPALDSPLSPHVSFFSSFSVTESIRISAPRSVRPHSTQRRKPIIRLLRIPPISPSGIQCRGWPAICRFWSPGVQLTWLCLAGNGADVSWWLMRVSFFDLGGRRQSGCALQASQEHFETLDIIEVNPGYSSLDHTSFLETETVGRPLLPKILRLNIRQSIPRSCTR